MIDCPECDGEGGWWIQVDTESKDWQVCEDCRGVGRVSR